VSTWLQREKNYRDWAGVRNNKEARQNRVMIAIKLKPSTRLGEKKVPTVTIDEHHSLSPLQWKERTMPSTGTLKRRRQDKRDVYNLSLLLTLYFLLALFTYRQPPFAVRPVSFLRHTPMDS
jgi:hypothetical protein